MITQPVVVKIGGVAASDPDKMSQLAKELLSLSQGVLVHGGGAEVSRLSERLGLAPRFVDGIRMTTEPEMDVVEMVLAGTANKRLVRLINKMGGRAVGISGADAGLITGDRLVVQGELSRTATVMQVEPRLLQDLIDQGYLPVVAPTSTDIDGIAVNINADDVGFAIAGSLQARALVFLSDVPGVLVDDQVQPFLTPDRVGELIELGIVSGGMIPKVQNAITALSKGVGSVVIGSYANSGDLTRLLSGSVGTAITTRTKETRDE